MKPSSPDALTWEALLEDVEATVGRADLVLTSGRRYELESGDAADRLTIRGRTGEIILRVEVNERGPILSFAAAEIDVRAAGRMRLAAREVEIASEGDLTLSARGSIRQRAAGDVDVRASGDTRVEAAAIQLQASAEGVDVRAMRSIRLDGEHIGLNDDPHPAPFPWSRLAREAEG